MDLHRRVLADTAGLLGAATATVVDAGGLPMLCLSQVVALRSANPCWSLNAIDREEGPAAAPVEALALAASPMSEHRFLVGLWTAEHGYLHTGEVTVDVREDIHVLSGGQFEVRLTGVHQPLLDETRVGPFEQVLEPGAAWRSIRTRSVLRRISPLARPSTARSIARADAVEADDD